MHYVKQYSTPAELLRLLEERGLGIANAADGENIIKAIGYYRLSGYLYPFLQLPKTGQQFKPDSTFGAAVSLYEFDRALRLLVLDQIERIEVAVRSCIVNIACAESRDVFWMTTESRFANPAKYAKTLALIDKELQNCREDFIVHFRECYDNPYPPAWMLSEIIPLGVLTRIYENMASNSTKKKIARHFGLTIPVFSSWLTIVTLTRNTCCHHARLWNRRLTLKALTMRHSTMPWVSDRVQQGKVFFTLCIIKHFVDVIYPCNTFKADLKALLSKYPNVDTHAMGFPEGWEQEPLWR